MPCKSRARAALYRVSKINYIEPMPEFYLRRIESVPGVTVVAFDDSFGADAGADRGQCDPERS